MQGLGRGSYGFTYVVEDRERFQKRCALKELVPRGGLTSRAQQLFEREARALLELDHPRIPRLHAFFEEDGRFFLVQDYVEGESLESVLLRRMELPEKEARSLTVQLLQILEYLHSRTPPVVHRDIKPDNLIIGVDGQVYLIDFGAVREAISMGSLPDEHRTFVGTIGFAAPEHLAGRAVPPSDLYSVGATALYLVTGQPPTDWFDRETNTLSIDSVPTGMSESFRTFVKSSMAPELKNRYATAFDARKGLLAGATVVADPVTAPSPQSQPEVSPPVTLPRSTIAPAQRRRWRLAAGGVILASLAGITLVATRSGGSSSAVPCVGSACPPPGVPESVTPDVSPATRTASTTEASIVTDGGSLELMVRHPTNWRREADRLAGVMTLQDTAAHTLFQTAVQTLPAATTIEEFAQRWSSRVDPHYTLTSPLEPIGSSDGQRRYRSTVLLPGAPPRYGYLLVIGDAEVSGRFRWELFVVGRQQAIREMQRHLVIGDQMRAR
ncbi:MAG TPA: serine/threonine-protein kinase [Gemmatimonadaceae bacterium]|nr:serine/threonine-protein kinase [Gemmatimonadaceae bacterium]